MTAWQRLDSIGGRIILVALTAWLLWASFHSASPIVEAYRARTWPTATGMITSSRVEVGCGRGTSHYPKVEYRYEANGRVRVGNRIAFGNVGCGSRTSAQEVAEKYTPGHQVVVYYDPKFPEQSVLLVGAVFGGTWFMAALFGVIAALSLHRTLRHVR